jgi:hypothetical protein
MERPTNYGYRYASVKDTKCLPIDLCSVYVALLRVGHRREC